jgi:hypothetical protein
MVKPATKAAKTKEPDPEKSIIIDVGWQYNGGVYGLDVISEDIVREKFPEALINPSIRLGYDETEDYNRFHRPYWETLAQILTGLTPEQIASLGGVTIYDPENERVIWRWKPKTVKRR